jgi:phosphate transport system substrate-binding protein
LKKLCQKEATIAGASRPIREAEAKACQQHGVELIELPVAFDGIAIVVNPQNTWASSITAAELRKLWSATAEGKVKSWSDVRAGWPAQPIELYGPGHDSGTFDYFAESIVGEGGASRKDYVASEDDDVLVKNVAENKNALGYFGFSYYVKNSQRLKALALDDGVAENVSGPVAPTQTSIADGSYQPLSRPLFLYTSVEAARRKEVSDLVRFYLRAGRIVAADVGCVPLPDSLFELARQRFVSMHTGSAFQGLRSAVGITIEDLLRAETAEMAPSAQEPAAAP